MTPDINATVHPAAPPIAFERWVYFFDLVRHYRQLEELCSPTGNRYLASKLRDWQTELDAQIGWIAADLAAIEAAQPAAPAPAEGGAL